MSAVEMRSPEPSTTQIPSADELVARARTLAPKLRERAERAERERNVPLDSVQDFIDAGLLRILMPKRWGGYEHDHEVAFNVAVELGRSTCGSSAWCLNYLSDHLAILAHFPDEAQHDVWQNGPDVCIATSAAPTGKADVVPSGYCLNGRWSWCSGIRHSSWIMIGGLVFRPGHDHPEMRLNLIPTKDLTIHDTWHCAGLRGTGSNTVEANDVFVPEHRSVIFDTLRDGCSPGSKINTNPMYRAPFIAVHTYALLAPALGLAQGGYGEFVEWTKKRLLTYTQLAIAQHVPVQIKIADISAQIEAAGLIARRALATARAHYAQVTLDERVRMRRDYTWAMQTLMNAMDALIKISGSSGLLDSNPVQRCWRDVHAIASHIVMTWDVAAENFGRCELGLGRNEAYPMF